MTGSTIQPAYTAALRTYLHRPTEASLRDAYELGRRAMEDGAGILELAAMHGSAMDTLVTSRGGLPALQPEHVHRCAAFLAEALSPFEMTHRGFRAAHEVLRVSESRYRMLVDHAPWGIGQCTAAGTVLRANPALCEMLGYGSEVDLAAASEREGEVGRFPPTLTWSDRQSHEFEVAWRHANGTPVTLRMAGRLTADTSGADVVEIMCTDITAHRVLEAQLREAQKMEAVGRLAGGVAHEINNFITGIVLYSHLASRALTSDDPRRRHADEIRLAAHRASLLTEQLLTFSRRDQVTRRIIDVNDVMHMMVPLLRPLLGPDIGMELSLDETPCVVRADPTHLERVLLNLTMNACDAMPTGGQLTIETARRTSGGEQQVILTVRDTGVGMTADVLERVFEPFFTTKPVGRGTGLGLATCYAIATQCDGVIAVESVPGAGTLFTLTLPYIAEPPERLGGLEPEGPVAGGTETLLLADDDPAVRRAAEEILREAGYTVLVASSGDEAIAVLEATAVDGLHMLVTDIVMPGSDGLRVADCAMTRHPRIRVLVMTAHGRLPDQDGRPLAEDAVLRKPFTPRALLVRVREILDRPSAT